MIGGYVMPSRLTAKAIAGMVLQIAHGTPVADLPPADATAIPVFDWQQLERWHISERSLPTGSVVLNRPPAIWREHPLLAMAVSGVLIGQLTLIAVLVVHRGRRRRAEGLLRRSEARTTALLRMVPDLMFVMSRDGVYLDYHARNPDDLFVKPDQFLGKRFRDIFSPDHARIFEEKFAEALRFRRTGGRRVFASHAGRGTALRDPAAAVRQRNHHDDRARRDVAPPGGGASALGTG